MAVARRDRVFECSGDRRMNSDRDQNLLMSLSENRKSREGLSQNPAHFRH
jgi:hypothetical protein